jgi:hypothetical protein
MKVRSPRLAPHPSRCRRYYVTSSRTRDDRVPDADEAAVTPMCERCGGQSQEETGSLVHRVRCVRWVRKRSLFADQAARKRPQHEDQEGLTVQGTPGSGSDPAVEHGEAPGDDGSQGLTPRWCSIAGSDPESKKPSRGAWVDTLRVVRYLLPPNRPKTDLRRAPPGALLRFTGRESAAALPRSFNSKGMGTARDATSRRLRGCSCG